MKLSILNKVAFRSILSHKRLYFPFLLAVSLLFSLEYILLSLLQNEYVNEFHPDLGQILGIGVFFSTVLIIIITLYANNFIQKNQTEEFGLYTILGLEKKHLQWISIIQSIFNWVVTSILSVVFGYFAGSLMFIGLNRLMKNTGATLMDYPFQIDTALGTSIILFGTFTLGLIVYMLKIKRLNPIELFKSSRKAEAEPKSRVWMTLIGLGALAGGYYIALTTDNVLESLLYIFIAILLVVIGTYFLFISLSTFILKLLRKNKNIYYKPNNFLSISGMLHRMNNNAISLASIAILCSGVILVLGITTTVYRTMETQIESAMPYDYEVSQTSLESYNVSPKENQKALHEIINEAENYGELTDVNIRTVLQTDGYLEENSLVLLPVTGSSEFEELDPSEQPMYVIAETVSSYNNFMQEEKTLDKNEILMTSNLLDPEQYPTLEINGEMYQSQIVSSDVIPSNYGVEVIYIAFPTIEDLEQFRENYLTYSFSEGRYEKSSYSTSAFFNVTTNEEGVEAFLSQIEDERGLSVETQESVRQQMYQLYGGLLFVGLVVSIVLVIGTVLMLYFKQISEGYEDKGKYEIMKKVGLPDQLIRKTIRSQIIWIFFLPIAVAVVHNLVASKIMYMLIGLFGGRDLSIFITSYFGVLLTFTLIYLFFYWLTSRTYYDIIDDYSI